MENGDYYIWYNDCGRLQMKYPSEFVIGFLKNNLASGRILDLGCGSGRHVIAAAELGYEAHGVDLSASGLVNCASVAEQRGLEVHLHRATMSDTGYPDEYFQALVCYSAINGNSLADQKRIVNEIHRILAPAGILLINFYGKKDHTYKLALERGKAITEDTYIIPGKRFHPFGGTDVPDYLATFSTENAIARLLDRFSTLRQFEIFMPYGNASLGDDAKPSHLLYAIGRK